MIDFKLPIHLQCAPIWFVLSIPCRNWISEFSNIFCSKCVSFFSQYVSFFCPSCIALTSFNFVQLEEFRLEITLQKSQSDFGLGIGLGNLDFGQFWQEGHAFGHPKFICLSSALFTFLTSFVLLPPPIRQPNCDQSPTLMPHFGHLWS